MTVAEADGRTTRKYAVISADGHVESHAELWTGRIAEKFHDRAPRFGSHEGQDAWIMGDAVLRLSVDTATAGRPYDQMVTENVSYKRDGTYGPGLGDGMQRLREQDEDGIDAEVLYPPVFGPNFLRKILDKGDRDAYIAVIQGYNSWLGEEFCGVAPDRLIGTAMLPESGVDDAIAEMERCRRMGFRAVCLNKWPNGSNDPSSDDDRFWAASLEMGMRMAPHANFGRAAGSTREGDLDSSARMKAIEMELGSMSRVIARPSYTIGQLITTGVFDRFPTLMFYFAEADASWIPYHVASTDDRYLRKYHQTSVRLKRLPSEYWRDHLRFSFLNDPTALQIRYQIGLDLLMWGSDLPHVTGSYPHSREVLAAQFRDVPEDERRQILVDNVCDYFELDRDKDLTPTPA